MVLSDLRLPPVLDEITEVSRSLKPRARNNRRSR